VELAVLVKAVPRSEALRWDPVRRAVVRDGAELVLNPFDQRALRVALELRQAGDRVSVLSLGPPSVRPLLREARAAGADRAVHLCDSAFAGSDVLATSGALASALRRVQPALVLTGARTTDSDTGLVPSEVAARLGWPVVTEARAVRRGPGPSQLELDVDTPAGWATVATALPAVVAVGEKITKPLPVSPDQFARTPEASVETATANDLSLSEAEVGAPGSPTTVEGIVDVAPVRRGAVFADGPLRGRVREAVAALAPQLVVERRPAPPLPWPPAVVAEREVLVFATGATGEIDPHVLGILTRLRRSLPTHTISVAAYTAAGETVPTAGLEAAGALRGYALDPGASGFDSADVAAALSGFLDRHPKVAALVFPSSSFGREVAGQLAADRSLGVVGDATGVHAAPEGSLEWVKPSFAGTTLAAIRCRSVPVLTTVVGGLEVPATDGRADGGLAWTREPVPPPRGRVVRLGEHTEPAASPEVEGAEVLVAVGAGVGGPEGISQLLPTVRRWGASLVGTRRVVDAGWLPVRLQVGLTGRLLAPRLAVLLGVRGSPNHMVGWARAGAVLAVNRDAEAPVFRASDVGIVGSVDEVVPELAEPLERLLGPGRSG